MYGIYKFRAAFICAYALAQIPLSKWHAIKRHFSICLSNLDDTGTRKVSVAYVDLDRTVFGSKL